MFRKVLILYGVFQISSQDFLVPQTETTPNLFPYHAYVESKLYCLGALISTEFVVVNALCIDSKPTTTVYLGRSDDPYYTIINPREGQVIKASELIVHPKFSKQYSKDLLPYNIGLVKLANPAMITKTVNPISLASANQFPLQPGSLLNVTGYLDTFFTSNTLRYMTVRVRSQSECTKYYGQKILKDEEHCVEGLGDRLDWPGPLAMNGKLVGLSRVLSQAISCILPIASCKPQDVFLTLGPYIDWIYEITGIQPSNDDGSPDDGNNSSDHHLLPVPPRNSSTDFEPSVFPQPPGIDGSYSPFLPPDIKIPENSGFSPAPSTAQPIVIDDWYTPAFPPDLNVFTTFPPIIRPPKKPEFSPTPPNIQPSVFPQPPGIDGSYSPFLPPDIKIPENSGFSPAPSTAQPNVIDDWYTPAFPPDLNVFTTFPPIIRPPKKPEFSPTPPNIQPEIIGVYPAFPPGLNVFTPSPPIRRTTKNPRFIPSGPGTQFYYTQKTEQGFEIHGFQFGDGITLEGYKADPIITHNQDYLIDVPV